MLVHPTRRGWTATPFSERLGIRYPIVQGPFGGGRSTVELAAAVTNAGGLGSYGANDLEPEAIGEIVAGIRRLTSGPFNINLWVPLENSSERPPTESEYQATIGRLAPLYQSLGETPPRFADVVAGVANRFSQQVEAVLVAKPPVFSFIFGVPGVEVIREFKRRNIVTMGTATNVLEAEAIEAAGTDIVIASGSEAGGHRASFLRSAAESLAVSALVPQVVDRVRVPVIAAGGIADGRGAVAAMVLGARGVQVGTAFLATHESGASAPHKQALIDHSEWGTVLSRVFTGRHARGLINRMVRELESGEASLPSYPWHSRMTAPLARAAARAGTPELMALWAGQNVPLVKRQSAAEMMDFLVNDIDKVVQRTELLSRK